MMKPCLKSICFTIAVWHLFVTGVVAKHGLIGMGINMYRPFCCNACHDSFSKLFLNCTTILDDVGTTSAACRASNSPWLHSVAYCFQQECPQRGLDDGDIQSCWAQYSDSSDSQYTDWIPTETPTVELTKDTVWLNETTRVNPELYRVKILSYGEWQYEEDWHTNFGVILLVVPVAFGVIVGVLRFIHGRYQGSVLPRSISIAISRLFTLPALLGYRHLTPLPYDIGYLTSRPLTGVILAFSILNLVFSLLPIRNPWQSIDDSIAKKQIAAYFANRTGVLSFANFAIALLFSARNNPIMIFARFDYTSCIAFHRWAMRISTIQAIIHSILFTLTYFWDGGYTAYATEAAKPYYWWGIIATVIMALIVAFAVLPLRKRQYELFLVVHIASAILFLIGCWYHIIKRYGKNWGYEVYLYIAFAFWAGDRLARLIRIAIFHRSWRSTSAIAELLPGNVFVKLTVPLRTNYKFKPGQYAFLYFPTVGKPYESHPFSIATWTSGARQTAPSSVGASDVDPGKNLANIEKRQVGSDLSIVEDHHESLSRSGSPAQSVTFLIRASTGKTLGLRDFLISHASDGPISLPVFFEGTYGYSPDLHRADSILAFAGGIGITGILGHIQAHIDQARTGLQKGNLPKKVVPLVVHWSVREKVLVTAVQSLLPQDASDLGVDLKISWTESTSEGHESTRIDISQILQDQSRTVGQGRLAVLTCAPARMADDIRKAVVKTVQLGSLVDLHEEAFAW